jgi:hypothetical protein
MVAPEELKPPGSASGDAARTGVSMQGWDETAGRPFDSLNAAQSPNQDRVETMVRALRRWLEANELFAIVTGVLGVLMVLSLLLVLGGYLIVTR